MRVLNSILLALLMTGCDKSFTVTGELDANGVPNPPNLDTPIQIDEIVQVDPPKADILWVVDNSGSMSDMQRKLTRNFPVFADIIADSGVEWQIGVVSTDMDDESHQGRLRKIGRKTFLTPDTEDLADKFGALALVGSNGSGTERGREAVFAALTDPLVTGHNDGFYRDDAYLHVIVISDENDDSQEPSKNEFIDWMRNLKEDDDKVTFSAIVAPRGLFSCFGQEGGGNYLDVLDAVGGVFQSICDNDWAPALEELGLQVAALKQEFFLSEVPVPGTISITVTKGNFAYVGVDLGTLRRNQTIDDVCDDTCFGFWFNNFRNSVIFDGFVPERKAKLKIRYQKQAQYYGEQ